MPAEKRNFRCKDTTSDGRRCNLSRAKNTSLCAHHQRRQDLYAGADRIAAKLFGRSQRLHTAVAINRVLARLFALVARNRIPVRHAAILAYIGQLLLQSIPQIRKERLAQEYAGLHDAFTQALAKRAGSSAPSADADQVAPQVYAESRSAAPPQFPVVIRNVSPE